MPELVIGSLALRVTDASGQANRVEAITLRALDLLGTRLGELDGTVGHRPAARDQTPSVLDLANQTDDEAAAIVAGAWLDALALRLEG